MVRAGRLLRERLAENLIHPLGVPEFCKIDLHVHDITPAEACLRQGAFQPPQRPAELLVETRTGIRGGLGPRIERAPGEEAPRFLCSPRGWRNHPPFPSLAGRDKRDLRLDGTR